MKSGDDRKGISQQWSELELITPRTASFLARWLQAPAPPGILSLMTIIQLLAMAKPEAMQVFDLPMAVMFIVTGVIFIAMRKQQAAARMERVKRGELSLVDAQKRDRALSWGAYFITIIGIGLLAAYFAGI